MRVSNVSSRQIAFSIRFNTNKYFKEKATSMLATLSIRLIPSARYLWSVCNFQREPGIRHVFSSSFFWSFRLKKRNKKKKQKEKKYSCEKFRKKDRNKSRIHPFTLVFAKGTRVSPRGIKLM